MGLFGRRKEARGTTSLAATGATNQPPEPVEQIRELENPGLPAEHPRQMLHQNLCTQTAMIWYSPDHDGHTLLNYVLELIDLTPSDLSETTSGYGLTPGSEGAIIVTLGRKGYAVYLFSGDMANRALIREADIFNESMSRGQYDPLGRRSVISHGQVLAPGTVSIFIDGERVLDHINGADVVPLSQMGC